LPKKADSDRSWTVKRETIEKNNFDMKAVNPTPNKLEKIQKYNVIYCPWE